MRKEEIYLKQVNFTIIYENRNILTFTNRSFDRIVLMNFIITVTVICINELLNWNTLQIVIHPVLS